MNSNPQPSHRILFLTGNFPPANDSGTYRIVKFIKYLASPQWQITVVTPETQVRKEQEDISLFQEVQHAEIHRVKLEPRQEPQPLTWEPFINHLPDNEKLSQFTSLINYSNQLIKKQGINFIFCSTPPHSLQYIAYIIASQNHIPLFMDIRDPFFHQVLSPTSRGIYTRDSHLAKKLHHTTAAIIFNYASMITCTTKSIALQIKSHLPYDQNKLELLPNGFDEEEFINLEKDIFPSRGLPLVIKHIGSLFASRTIPPVFWKTLARLSLQPGIQPGDISFQIIGIDHAHAIHQEYIKKFNLQAIVTSPGHISHRNSLEEMLSADVLLLFQPRMYWQCIPGKTYDYLRSHRKIITIAHRGSETAKFLAGFPGISICNNSTTIYQELFHLYTEKKNGQAMKMNDGPLSSFNRKNLAKQLEGYFQQVLGQRIDTDNLVQQYRQASGWENEGKWAEAETGFKKIIEYRLNPAIPLSIIAGAFYHLATICYKKKIKNINQQPHDRKDISTCRAFLRECLLREPGHEAAGQLLRKIAKTTI